MKYLLIPVLFVLYFISLVCLADRFGYRTTIRPNKEIKPNIPSDPPLIPKLPKLPSSSTLKAIKPVPAKEIPIEEPSKVKTFIIKTEVPSKPVDLQQAEIKLSRLVTNMKDSCRNCNKQDKRVFNQLMLLKAIREGNTELAEKYIDEIDGDIEITEYRRPRKVD